MLQRMYLGFSDDLSVTATEWWKWVGYLGKSIPWIHWIAIIPVNRHHFRSVNDWKIYCNFRIFLQQWNMAIERVHHLWAIFIVRNLHLRGISHKYVFDITNEKTYLGHKQCSLDILINNMDEEIPLVFFLHQYFYYNDGIMSG